MACQLDAAQVAPNLDALVFMAVGEELVCEGLNGLFITPCFLEVVHVSGLARGVLVRVVTEFGTAVPGVSTHILYCWVRTG